MRDENSRRDLQRWSNEQFIIVLRCGTNPPTYKPQDLKNTVLNGSFCEWSEIRKTSTLSVDHSYQIDVIRSRKWKGKNRIYCTLQKVAKQIWRINWCRADIFHLNFRWNSSYTVSKPFDKSDKVKHWYCFIVDSWWRKKVVARVCVWDEIQIK